MYQLGHYKLHNSFPSWLSELWIACGRAANFYNSLFIIIRCGELQPIVIIVNQKITRSPHLGTLVTRKHNKSVEFGKKNWPHCASNRVARPTSITNSVFVGHRSHICISLWLMHTTVLLCVGKGRQQCMSKVAWCCISDNIQGACRVCTVRTIVSNMRWRHQYFHINRDRMQ